MVSLTMHIEAVRLMGQLLLTDVDGSIFSKEETTVVFHAYGGLLVDKTRSSMRHYAGKISSHVYLRNSNGMSSGFVIFYLHGLRTPFQGKAT